MRVLGTIVAVVLLAGCSTGTPEAAPTRPAATTPAFTVPPTPPRPVGTPLPVPVTKIDIPYPSAADVEAWVPPVGPEASAVEQIQRTMRFETLLQARVRAPTTARCGRVVFTASAQSPCTVYYQGLPVPFTVVMAQDEPDRPNGLNGLWRYRTYQDRYVIRADVIRAEAWRRWGSDGEPVRCSRMPAVRVLPAGVTKDRCQHFVDGAWEPAEVEVTDVGSVIVL